MNTPIQKERYLFVRYNDSSHFDKYFRANYIDIVRKQLRVYHYEDSITHLNRDIYLHVMPLEWIESIYKLEDIIGDSVLPLDIVRLINNFW
jgi:hypothetical protein